MLKKIILSYGSLEILLGLTPDIKIAGMVVGSNDTFTITLVDQENKLKEGNIEIKKNDNIILPINHPIEEVKIEDFLEQIYSLDVESAIDKLEYIDELLCRGEFATCDNILLHVNIEKLTPTLMRSFLSITSAAKDKLPSRKSLYNKIKEKLIEIKGEEKTARLINALE